MGENQSEKLAVILIHGLASNRLFMSKLSRSIQNSGFEVCNWGYRSTRKTIGFHASQFQRLLEQFDRRQDLSGYHIVAHSMGNIVTRRCLAEYHPSGLRRIVMLCPPNHGSHVARRVAPWVRPLIPTMSELTDNRDSMVNQLDSSALANFEVGLITADNDLVVHPESADLPQVDHRTTVPGMHVGMLFSNQTCARVLEFLKHGEFLDASNA